MARTFADQFVPRRQAHNDSPTVRFVPPTQRWDASQQQLASEQVKSFRLWNYVAIDANATKAAESVPQVSVRKQGGGRRMSQVQRQYLRQFYPRVLQSSDDDLMPAPDGHPLCELLRRVNSEDWWSTFAYETYLFLQLTGAFYWWAVPSGVRTESAPHGLPAELYVIPTQWIRGDYAKSGELIKWIVTPHDDKRLEFDLPPHEVIRGIRKNPLSKVDPLSPVSAGAEWIENSRMIERARHLTYKHGNLQTVLLEIDPDLHQNITPDQITAIGDKFLQRYGGFDKSMRPIVQPPGFKAQPFGIEPSKMLLPEVSDQIRDFVLSLHGVPKVIVGISDDVNRASIYGANLIWCQHRIMPLQQFLAGCMTEKLASRYDDNLVVWFDDCRPHDDEAERADTELDFRMGAITPDERRMERGRDPLNVPESQRTYLPAGVTPLIGSDQESADSAPAAGGDESSEDDGGDSDDDPEQESQRLLVYHHSQRAVMLGARERRLLDAFHRSHGRVERGALRELRSMWGKLSSGVLRRFDDGARSVDDLLPGDVFRPAFNDAMTVYWTTGLALGGNLERRHLKDQVRQEVELPDIGVDFPDEMRAGMEAYLEARQAGVWGQVLSTTHNRLGRAIADGLAEGEDIRTIRDRVQSALNTTRSQATVIARTEATASLNHGQAIIREVDEIERKVWIATIDSLTRATHMAADQQVVDSDKPFTIGGYSMRYPGDGSMGAPAEEIVQCRCTAAGVVE